LPAGIPSQDTFEHIFAVLRPELWQSRFLAWTQTLVLPELPEGEDEVLAIDGKTARGSGEKHLPSCLTLRQKAWCGAQKCCNALQMP
jgi:hypothetical protein